MALPTDVLLRGTRAAQPAASDFNTGKLYCVTDEFGRVEQSDGATWVYYGVVPVGAGLTFTADTGSITDADPGAGLFKWDNATQASATQLFFDDLTIDGISVTTFWGSLGSAGFIYLQQFNDADRWQLWRWTAATVDGTGYRKFTVTLQAKGTDIEDAAGIYCQFNDAAGSAVADDSVTNAKLANMAEATFKMRAAGAGTGDPIDGTAAQAKTALAISTSDVSGLGTAAAKAADIDGTLAANSDANVPTQKAVKTYVDSIVAANDAMVFRGVIDCSANPNYPAADRGWTYRVSVAGKIGGASGPNVEAGDLLLCLTDSTATGDHATVGTAWTIAQVNLDGAVIGPASATDSRVARFDGATGKLLKDGGTDAALVGGAITGATDKATPVDADELGIADSAASFALKKLTWANLKAGIWTALGALIAGGTAKTTPVDADTIALSDSSASNATKKVAWSDLKATLKTYFDTLYAGGASGALRHVASVDVSGAAVTDIDFSGLDLDTDEKYIIEVSIKNSGASDNGIRLMYNADTTETNYYRQATVMSGTSVTTSTFNNAGIGQVLASSYVVGQIEIWKPAGADVVRAVSRMTGGATTSARADTFGHKWTSAANVTSIKLRGLVASGFDVGSYARLYKQTP